ncbi:DnaJ domain-containing protein [Devosia sp. ZB163]|uniref:DnaJ domain-containing protein n=1 Tax=Devosia sp. ZB163 TaxID=3025938 RepID=UPI00235EEEBF|nr:DnaJ domain-containing protein [Devosia sp. ZB163]MDC9822932.1 DnaJ domain-containing protein [Devosia sp. ZB163]
MNAFDPYDVLGVGRSARAAEVKLAYRRKVQVAHPDRGGDPELFILVVRAFGLLSDPDSRRLFDETGIVDDEAVKGYRREVATILADMFDAAVETAVATGLKLESVDFIAQMAAAVVTGLADARVTLNRTDNEIGALQTLRARIRRTDEDRNLFAERLDAQVALKTEQHRNIKRRVAMLETALAELGNYQSETELIAALEAEA